MNSKNIGLVKKNKKYFEINSLNINSINKRILPDDSYDVIKINIDNFNNKIIIRIVKIIYLVTEKYNIDIDKYIFYVDHYDESNMFYLNQIAAIITADKINNVKERYSYIYDFVSYELDYLFNTYNICNFKNNICCRKRCLVNKLNHEILKYGCCYTKGKVCKYLDKNHCTINCLPCKFFTCSYLKKKGYNYKPKDFAIINYFFNINQKKILINELFTDKNIIIDKLIKKKNRFK